MLSSITPTMKYLLQHSSLSVQSIATGRIVIGFLFLAVLILASILIAYQAWKIAAQKEEVADSPS